MKPIATMFCAAAVLMPTFQMLAVCTVVIISMLANAPFRLTPKAAMMPSVIGTRQATRAVVDGTRKAMTKPTRMVPMTTWRVSVPTRDRMVSAMRRSRPVAVMAAARNSAEATSTSAVLAKPLKASAEAGARAHQGVRIGRIGRQAEQERHQRGDDDGRDRVVERLGHPDDHREGEDREHAVARDRKPLGRRQQGNRDQGGNGQPKAPIRTDPMRPALGGAGRG